MGVKGLLLRLSALDADAAAAVRVIAHFQALLGRGLDATALVRSTAGLAECPAGLELPDGRIVRAGPDGTALTGRPRRISGSTGLRPTGRVWLERPGAPGPFDDLVLEWMAIAAGTLESGSGHGVAPQVADPALVERVLSEHEPVADRAHALRGLGLDPAAPLRVTTVTCSDGVDAGLAAVALFGRGRLPGTVRVARLGAEAVVLLQRRDGTDSPCETLRTVLCERAGERAGRRGQGVGRAPRPGAVSPPPGTVAGEVRAGVGGAAPALTARTSWQQARNALRFAVAEPPQEAIVDHDELGPVALLAEIPLPQLRDQPDVRALVALAEQPGGRAVIEALAAFCRTGSLRQAAAGMYLHHSSVAARLVRAERALGRGLSDPQDRFAAQLALYAYRLATAPLS